MGSLQSSCVFFSSFSILLIAADRYLILIRAGQRQISTKQVKFESSTVAVIYLFLTQAFSLSALSLLLSVAISSPLFFHTKLDSKTDVLSQITVSFCTEVGVIFNKPALFVPNFASKLTCFCYPGNLLIFNQKWPTDATRRYYTTVCFLVQFLGPSVAVALIYIRYIISYQY